MVRNPRLELTMKLQLERELTFYFGKLLIALFYKVYEFV